MVDMNSREWNLMISMVNYGYPREEVSAYFSEEKMKIYDDMKAELDEMRKTNPKAAFWPVELDW